MASGKSAESPKPIDIFDLWNRFRQVFRKMWVVIVIAALLGGSVFYIRSRNQFVPSYESRAMFSVSSGYTADDIFSVSYYDNAAAKTLAETFPYMLGTDLMRDLIMEHTGKQYINGSISAASQANTNLFILTVNSSSAQDAYDILCAVIDVFPQVAVYMMDHPQMVILEEPSVPQVPNNSFSGFSALFKGTVFGGAAGIVLLGMVAIATTSVYSVDQLKEIINVPVLAVIPAVRSKKRRSQKVFLMPVSSPQISETIRGLSMKVTKALEPLDNKVVVVTSTLKGEGKTTVASNLAMDMAKSGNRVVLVDGDLRSQSAAQRFGLRNGAHGLLDCMKDPKLPVAQQLQQVPDTSLWILSGTSVSERSYSIDPKGMRRILDSLRKDFDYVVMDTSPCAMVAETALLCHYAGFVLYVVRPEYARKAQIMDSVNELYDRGVRVEGLVYNGAAMEHSRYGYGYKYGYGYGYKYGYGYGYKYGYGSGYGYSNKKRKKKK